MYATGSLREGTDNAYQKWLDAGKRRLKRDEIDLKRLFEISSCMCSQGDIAQSIGISRSYFAELLQEWPAFAEAVLNGQASTRALISGKQIELAKRGNAQMLIWLGKQYLGQRDKHDIESHTTVNVMVSQAMEELSNIPRERLLEAREMLAANVIEHEPVKVHENASEG